jgi:RNA polymerase sigma factor (sigma-70 family)
VVGAAPEHLAEDLFNEHSRRIYAYCLRQLGSPEEAEDALQATYLNACRSLLSGFEPEVAQAWLFKVAQNVCLTRRRSSWRRRRVERPEDIQEMQDFIPAREAADDELFGIDAALAALPEQQRRAILLREWQGLSYREVAAEMDLSQGAVETLIFRARRSLVAALEEPEALPTRRARLMGAFDGGALLASLKAALGGNLSTSLATGLAVAATAGTIAAAPVGRADILAPAPAPKAHVMRSHSVPTARPALADRDPSSVARQNAGNGWAKGKGHGHGRIAGAGKAHHGHSSHGGGKPSWAGGGGPPAHAQAGGGGRGKGR